MPIRKHHAAAVGLAALFAAASAQGAPSSWTLTKVEFVGNSQVPTSELQAALPIQPGSKLQKSDLQAELDAIGNVYHTHNVGVSIGQRFSALGKTASLTYTLTEQAPQAPTVVHVGITADNVLVAGNSKVSTASILAAANIPPGSQVDTAKIQAAQAAIAALYHKKNIGVSVNTNWTTPSPQHVVITFTVAESG